MGRKPDRGLSRPPLPRQEDFRKRQAELREQGRYIGIGVSPFVEPTAFGSAVAKASGLPANFYDAATVTLQPDGSAVVTTGLHNHGQGHDTVFAQVAADALGLTLDQITVIQGDTQQTPYGSGTYASRSAVIGGGTIMRAAREVREKLLRLAAGLMEVSPEDIELANGVASVAGVPDKSMSVAEITGFTYFGGDLRPPDIEPDLTATKSYDPPETYSNGCTIALVEVDPATGEIDLQRMAVVEDCGTMLNPMIVDGQVAGAVAQGVGGALLEDLVYDENGMLLSGSLMDFLYPTTTEVPRSTSSTSRLPRW